MTSPDSSYALKKVLQQLREDLKPDSIESHICRGVDVCRRRVDKQTQGRAPCTCHLV